MSLLKNAINSVDPTPDMKKDMSLALSLLFELAENKKKLHEEWLKSQLRTAGTEDNPSLPITNTLGWHNEVRAFTQKSYETLDDQVKEILNIFLGGSENPKSMTATIITGIAKLLTTSIKTIMGEGEGAEREMHTYFIAPIGYAIIRFDVVAWNRHIVAQGISKEIENAMTFTAVKSSVDVSKISFNTFLMAYNEILEQLEISPKEVKKYIEAAQEIFNLLKDNDNKIS